MSSTTPGSSASGSAAAAASSSSSSARGVEDSQAKPAAAALGKGTDLKSRFEVETLGKTNFKWTCTLCAKRGCNAPDMLKHAQMTHAAEWGKEIEDWEAYHTRKRKAPAGSAKQVIELDESDDEEAQARPPKQLRPVAERLRQTNLTEFGHAMRKADIVTEEDVLASASDVALDMAWPFSTFDNPHFKSFIRRVFLFGQQQGRHVTWQTPGSYKMVHKFIEPRAHYLASHARQRLQADLDRGTLYVLADGRTTNRSCAEHLMVVGTNGTAHLGSINPGTEAKTGENLRTLWQEVVARSEYKDHIVALFGDGAANVKAAMRLITASDALLTAPCQCHGLNRVLAHICALDEVAGPLAQAEKVINVFRRHQLEALLKEAGGKQLKRVVETRFVVHVDVGRRLLLNKRPLTAVINGPQWAEIKGRSTATDRAELEEVEHIIADEATWKVAEFLARALDPLVLALREFDSGACLAPYVCQTWASLADRVAAAMGADFSFLPAAAKKRIAEIIIDLWRKYDSPIFAAAHVLNYALHAQVSALKREDKDEFALYENALMDAAITLYRRFDPATGKKRENILAAAEVSAEYKRQIKNQLKMYLSGTGEAFRDLDFESLATKTRLAPYEFWVQVADEVPELAFVGVLCCGAPASTSDLERAHKDVKEVAYEARNRLKPERLDKCVGARVELKQSQTNRGRVVTPASTFFTLITKHAELDIQRLEEYEASLAVPASPPPVSAPSALSSSSSGSGAASPEAADATDLAETESEREASLAVQSASEDADDDEEESAVSETMAEAMPATRSGRIRHLPRSLAEFVRF